MHWRRPRTWLVVAGCLAILAAAGFHVYARWFVPATGDITYSKIEAGIWLGGAVPDAPAGCDAVLNLCEFDDPYRVTAYQWSAIRDAAPAPSLEWLDEQVRFIEAQRTAGRGVYVHCFAGASRSSFVLAAYLMRRERWSRDEAIDYLKERRPEVRPNPAFLERLAEWEAALKAK